MTNSSNTIRPADRVGALAEYYLQKKMAVVARMNAEGKDIISLGIGGPDGPAPAEAIDTTAEMLRRPDTHSYQLGTGIPALREAYAGWYADRFGVTLDPATQILPLIGSKEGILHVSLTFLNPGDKVLVPNPGYPTYTAVSRIVGAEVITYDLTADGGWYPDFDALEASDLSGVKLMWINYPHMPTGTPATRELFEKTVAFGRRHGILIAHDNPYSFILNREPLSLLSIPGAMETAIEMNSLSKSHNMAGWRMGMVAGSAEHISWIRRIKSNIDSGQFRPVMEGAVKALAQPQQWYDDLYDMYASRRKAAERVMDALGSTFDPGQRGMFLWGRVPDSVADVETFADEVLARARVFITPGFIFGSNGARYIRISLCAPVEKIDEARRRIAEAFPEYSQK